MFWFFKYSPLKATSPPWRQLILGLTSERHEMMLEHCAMPEGDIAQRKTEEGTPLDQTGDNLTVK